MKALVALRKGLLTTQKVQRGSRPALRWRLDGRGVRSGGKVKLPNTSLEIPVWDGIDVPTAPYDNCYDNYKDKIPGLPKPPGKEQKK